MMLIMWSGGVESTALLKWATESDVPVWAHHCVIKSTLEPRWMEEIHSVERLKKFFPNVKWTTSMHDLTYTKYTGADYIHTLTTAALLSNNDSNIRSIMCGICKDDTLDEMLKLRQDSGMSVFNAISNRPIQVELNPQPFVSMMKSEIIDYIGKEIFEHTWSCRTPVNGQHCGKCKSCHQRGVTNG